MHNEESLTIQELEKRCKRLEWSLENYNKINSTLDQMSVMKMLLDSIADLVQAEAASVFLIDEEAGELVLEGANNLDTEKNRISIPVGQGIAGTVAATGETINIQDASKDSRFSKEADKKTGFITRSYLCLPMFLHNKVIGAVAVLNKKTTEYFSEEDVEVLQDFANQAAGAVENSRLYSRVLQQQVELEEKNHNLQTVLGYVHQLIDAITLSYDEIKGIYTISEEMVEVTKTGVLHVRETGEGIEVISHFVQEIETTIHELLKNIRVIDDFLKNISDIADKTKVLAINTAIEAARAGIHGKGFAVISTEVRNLANQTSTFTDDIGKVLGTVKDNYDRILKTMTVGGEKIDRGRYLSQQAVESLGAIKEVVISIESKLEAVQSINDREKELSDKIVEKIG